MLNVPDFLAEVGRGRMSLLQCRGAQRRFVASKPSASASAEASRAARIRAALLGTTALVGVAMMTVTVTPVAVYADGGAGGAGGGGGDGFGGNGGAGAASSGGSGVDGSDGISGGGGGGGAHGEVGAGLPGSPATGGNGGRGGDGKGVGTFSGGGGGAGGYGAVVTGAGGLGSLSHNVIGGTGGAGGSRTVDSFGGRGGSGGSGGAGLWFSDPGAKTLTIDALVSVTGGAGGWGRTSGIGGAGIVGQNLTITNYGTISGGVGSVNGNAITFTGGTNVINFGGPTSGLTGNVSVAGTLQLNAFAGGTTVSNAIIGAGGIIQNSANTLILSGANTYTGITTITAGTLQIGAGGATGTLGSGSVANNATLVFNRNDTLTVDNLISGSGSLTQAGTGTLILTAANTYSGLTTVSNGLLQFGANNIIADASAVVVNGGTLSLQAFSDTVASVNMSAGSITGTGTLATTTYTQTGGTLSGILSASGDRLLEGGTISGRLAGLGATTIQTGTVL